MHIAYNRRERMAGLFFVGGLVTLFLLALAAGGGKGWFQSYNSYYAIYNEGYGLAPGVKVRFLRTDVGLVTRLELTENDKVKVHMSILTEYAGRIKSDSVAAIASPTFIGSEYIDILPGSSRSAPIPEGGQIPAVERKSLQDYLIDLKLDVILARVESTLANIDSLTRQLQEPEGPLLGVLSDIHSLSSTVAQGDGSLGHFIIEDEAYQRLAEILDRLQKVAQDIGQVSGELKDELPPIMRDIQQIAEQARQAADTLPDTARRVNYGARGANEVLDSAKRNFLIRGNLTPPEEPRTNSLPARNLGER